PASRRAVDFHLSAVALHRRADYRHPESRAARLGREEELEDVRARFLVHAAARVLDQDLDLPVLTPAAPYGEGATRLHRVDRVHDEVEKRLVQLAGVEGQRSDRVAKVRDHPDAPLRDAILDERQTLLEEPVDPCPLAPELRRT